MLFLPFLLSDCCRCRSCSCHSLRSNVSLALMLLICSIVCCWGYKSVPNCYVSLNLFPKHHATRFWLFIHRWKIWDRENTFLGRMGQRWRSRPRCTIVWIGWSGHSCEKRESRVGVPGSKPLPYVCTWGLKGNLQSLMPQVFSISHFFPLHPISHFISHSVSNLLNSIFPLSSQDPTLFSTILIFPLQLLLHVHSISSYPVPTSHSLVPTPKSPLLLHTND